MRTKEHTKIHPHNRKHGSESEIFQRWWPLFNTDSLTIFTSTHMHGTYVSYCGDKYLFMAYKLNASIKQFKLLCTTMPLHSTFLHIS